MANRRIVATGLRFVLGVFAVLAPSMAHLAAAQDRRQAAAEFAVGRVGFADDGVVSNADLATEHARESCAGRTAPERRPSVWDFSPKREIVRGSLRSSCSAETTEKPVCFYETDWHSTRVAGSPLAQHSGGRSWPCRMRC
jgi:hypothetical protein